MKKSTKKKATPKTQAKKSMPSKKKAIKAKEPSRKTAIIIAVVLAIIAIILLVSVVKTSIKMEEQSKGNPIAVLETTKGTIKIELFKDQMPITAGNFEKLVTEKTYEGTRFHRVIANFMIQGGDPKSANLDLINEWGTGDAGYKIEDEFVEGENLSNARGTLSMANSGRPNTGGSQFFINVADNTFLDFDKEPLQSKHPVFGKVVEGMDVVDAIVNSETTGAPFDRPVEEVVITKTYLE